MEKEMEATRFIRIVITISGKAIVGSGEVGST